MPPIGAGRVDLRTFLNSVVNFIKSRVNNLCDASCDGLVLRMHYRWTFFVLLGTFFMVWYSWYHHESISCVIHYDASKQVRLDYINICLSYPFVKDPVTGNRRYIMFYRWIAFSLFVLAGLYYVPRKVSKGFDNSKCTKLLADLASNAQIYSPTEQKLLETATYYMKVNFRTHNGLYWKYLTVNIVALAVDIFTFLFLNFILQGRFIQYGINTYPFTRDPREFTDYMSQTFPPFVSCIISRKNQLTSEREETLGCHLTLMELYEKIFLGLWFWLILLTIFTCCYIVFLFTMWLPCVQKYLLRSAKPAHANDKVRQIITKVSRNCKIGDVYLLYRLKGHLSHAKFYELLVWLSDPNLVSKPAKQSDIGWSVSEKDALVPYKQVNNLKQRLPTMSQDPCVNTGYQHQQIANPQTVNTHIQHPNQSTSPLKQNTTILID